MANNSELACVYAALILHDDGVEVTVRAARGWRADARSRHADGWMAQDAMGWSESRDPREWACSHHICAPWPSSLALVPAPTARKRAIKRGEARRCGVRGRLGACDAKSALHVLLPLCLSSPSFARSFFFACCARPFQPPQTLHAPAWTRTDWTVPALLSLSLSLSLASHPLYLSFPPRSCALSFSLLSLSRACSTLL